MDRVLAHELHRQAGGAWSSPSYPYFAGIDNHGVNDNKSSPSAPRRASSSAGPNKNYGGDATPPLGAVGYNRFYRDWAEQRQARPDTWEITENSIKYQGPYVNLASAFYAQALPTALRLDPAAGGGSDGNQVFEPGETVTMAPAWRNHRFVASAITGAASAFTGPAGPAYTIADAAASYGTMAAGAPATAWPPATATALTVRGAARQHWDASVTETLGSGEAHSWTLHLGDSFADVPRASGFYRFVETMLHRTSPAAARLTAYCPSGGTTRDQMAVFVLVAKEGSGFGPPACIAARSVQRRAGLEPILPLDRGAGAAGRRLRLRRRRVLPRGRGLPRAALDLRAGDPRGPGLGPARLHDAALSPTSR